MSAASSLNDASSILSLSMLTAFYFCQGAFTFRGSMIDMPSLLQAKNIVQLLESIKAGGGGTILPPDPAQAPTSASTSSSDSVSSAPASGGTTIPPAGMPPKSSGTP